MSLIDCQAAWESVSADGVVSESHLRTAIKSIDPSLPANANIITRSEPLLNAGSPDMNVNGAATQQTFTIAPATGQVWYANVLGLQIEDGSQADLGKFGNIGGGLTNGLLIEQTVNSNLTTLKNLRFNEQIIMHFTIGGAVTGNVGLIKSPGFFQGHFTLGGANSPMTLRGDNGDKIDVIVRDNLAPINFLRMALTWWEVF